MIWVKRLAILFAGFIVGAVFLNLYYLACCFFTIFILGIENKTFLGAQYWLCFIAGFVTAYFVMRRTWPRAPAPNVKPAANPQPPV